MMSSLEQQVANMRLQLVELERAAQAASLPANLIRLRTTLRWSAAAVSAALIVSSAIRIWRDDEIHTLERRIEHLEHATLERGM